MGHWRDTQDLLTPLLTGGVLRPEASPARPLLPLLAKAPSGAGPELPSSPVPEAVSFCLSQVLPPGEVEGTWLSSLASCKHCLLDTIFKGLFCLPEVPLFCPSLWQRVIVSRVGCTVSRVPGGPPLHPALGHQCGLLSPVLPSSFPFPQRTTEQLPYANKCGARRPQPNSVSGTLGTSLPG